MMNPNLRPSLPAGARRQAGLSIVELLVGVAVGLLVVAAASMLTATQLGDNRRLLLETQVQQDLRAAADIVTRELRRSGSRVTPAEFLWTPTADGVDAGTTDDATPLAGTDTQALFRYSRAGIQGGQLGYRLNGTRVQSRLTFPNTWADLTDTKAIAVTAFNVTANHQDEPMPAGPAPQRIPCPKLCPPANDTSCWPVLKVREFTVTITGTAVSDPAVVRSLRTVVRPRNDQLVPAATVCPA